MSTLFNDSKAFYILYRVTVVSQEDQLRTQYVPETKVQIMKRPSSNDADSSAANRPKAPIKTLEQVAFELFHACVVMVLKFSD